MYFIRHGAWLTVNNVDLHLIKGRPCVHPDEDLIVGHIAITVDAKRMEILRARLTSFGIKFRRNVSVPNPTVTGGPSAGRVDQVKAYINLPCFNIYLFLPPHILKTVTRVIFVGLCERSGWVLY